MLLQLLTLILTFSSFKVSCKTATCRDSGCQFVSCSDITTQPDLSGCVSGTRGMGIQGVTLAKLFVNFIPHDLFQGLAIEFLELQRSSVLALSDTETAFEGLEDSLSKLWFMECGMMNEWDWSVLKNLRKLTSLRILGGDLNSIDGSVRQLSHLGLLKEVIFASDHISHIDDYAFADFSELAELSLRYNTIGEVKRSMFPNPANELRQLWLGNNEIKELPEDLFTNMPKLQYLDLRDNKLLTLKEETFAPVWNQLAMLETSGNKLRCDCRLKWVLAKPRIRQMTVVCDEPLRFRGKQVLELQPADLWC